MCWMLRWLPSGQLTEPLPLSSVVAAFAYSSTEPMKTNSAPASANKDGTYEAVFMASLIEHVEPELSPATVNFKRFLKNPVLLYQHYSMPVIGAVTDIVRRGGKITGRIKFDEEDEFAQLVAKKWKGGMLRACSMGLAYRNDTWELLEVSVVAIPRDPGAVRNELEAKLSEYQGGGEQNENSGVTTTEPTGLRIVTIQDRKSKSQNSDMKMSEPTAKQTEPTAAKPTVAPEPQAQPAEPAPVVPEYHMSAEELRAAYTELIPAEFAGDTPKAILAEASRLNPETHSLDYMRAIADTRLAQRKEAKTVKHEPATVSQATTNRRTYTLSEIHALQSRTQTIN